MKIIAPLFLAATLFCTDSAIAQCQNCQPQAQPRAPIVQPTQTILRRPRFGLFGIHRRRWDRMYSPRFVAVQAVSVPVVPFEQQAERYDEDTKEWLRTFFQGLTKP